ncbi:MAG: DNA-processing protein DprA [Prevotella sp.]|nr:DNA-processing protein DprA [Prevotella sp.]
MAKEQETLYTMALTRISNFNFAQALDLYRVAGSATCLYENREHIRDIIHDCSPRLQEALRNWDESLQRAEAEMTYMQQHRIRALTLNDPDYPQRLCECQDAPIVLYYLGNADLNQQHVINIVGTRRCTTYGQDLIRHFVADLRNLCPNVLIVSGLAYGIDICAHREALANGNETIGVLAHGLDKIYPYAHRNTAAEMTRQGGLLTEFMTQTNADKPNFVRRNRIVAGMSDACIVVESAAKGGGLITASIAQSYNRAVYAFPGAVNQPYSAGCNNLIRDNGAALICNAEDFVQAMGWQTEVQRQQAETAGIERTLFPNLSDEERAIVGLLQKTNDLQLNILSVKTNIPIGKLSALLFQMEMKGILKPMAGGMYHLLA